MSVFDVFFGLNSIIKRTNFRLVVIKKIIVLTNPFATSRQINKPFLVDLL